jgi:hypothetical protein
MPAKLIRMLDGKCHPFEHGNTTIAEEISTLQWDKAPDQIAYYDVVLDRMVVFAYVCTNTNDGDIVDWSYASNDGRSILIIND